MLFDFELWNLGLMSLIVEREREREDEGGSV